MSIFLFSCTKITKIIVFLIVFTISLIVIVILGVTNLTHSTSLDDFGNLTIHILNVECSAPKIHKKQEVFVLAEGNQDIYQQISIIKLINHLNFKLFISTKRRIGVYIMDKEALVTGMFTISKISRRDEIRFIINDLYLHETDKWKEYGELIVPINEVIDMKGKQELKTDQESGMKLTVEFVWTFL